MSSQARHPNQSLLEINFLFNMSCHYILLLSLACLFYWYFWDLAVQSRFWQPMGWGILRRASLWWLWICCATNPWPKHVCYSGGGIRSLPCVWQPPTTSKLNELHHGRTRSSGNQNFITLEVTNLLHFSVVLFVPWNSYKSLQFVEWNWILMTCNSFLGIWLIICLEVQ